MDNVADAAVGVVEHLDRLSSVQRMVTHLAADPQVDNIYLIDLEERRIVASSGTNCWAKRWMACRRTFWTRPLEGSVKRPEATVGDSSGPSAALRARRNDISGIPESDAASRMPRHQPAPGDQARLTTRRTLNLALAIVGLLALFLVVVLNAVRSRITEPLDQLARQVYAAGGEGNIEADENLGREIRGLVQAYNASLALIDLRQAANQAQLQAFRLAVSGASLTEILRPITDAIPKVFGSGVRGAFYVADQNRDRATLIARVCGRIRYGDEGLAYRR